MRIEARFSFVTKEYRKEGRERREKRREKGFEKEEQRRESGAIKEKPC
jgi:hypothetical protein